MRVILVAAVGEKWEIGKKNSLLWHVPEDLRHFREMTLGETVIMGRKTWESLPNKPLPGRRNIVLTRQKDYQAHGAEVYDYLVGALDSLEKEGVEEVYIIGGGEVYRHAMGTADCLSLTRIHKEDPEADTYFPFINPQDWKLFSFSDPEESICRVNYHYETWIRL